MILYGGWADPTPAHYGNVQILSFAGSPAWTTVTGGGTPPQIRDGHVAIWDAPNQRMVMCSGIDEITGSAWQLSFAGTPTWSPIAPFGGPRPQSALGRVYAEAGNTEQAKAVLAHLLGGNNKHTFEPFQSFQLAYGLWLKAYGSVCPNYMP